MAIYYLEVPLGLAVGAILYQRYVRPRAIQEP